MSPPKRSLTLGRSSTVTAINNVQDLDTIMKLCDAIVDGADTNWFLLHDDDSNGINNNIILLAHGSDGLSGLKAKILEDTEQTYFAYYREEVKVRPGFVVINYVPPSVSGVRRARALVHSRRITSVFKREEHACLTVDHLSNLTPTAIHQAILDPESTHTIQTERTMAPSPPPSDITNRSNPNAIKLGPVRRSFTETYASDRAPPPVQKTGSLFSGLLRRKGGRKGTVIESNEPPPPPPPKDNTRRFQHGVNAASMSAGMRSQPHIVPRRQRSISEFAIISHNDHGSYSDDEVMVERPTSHSPTRFSPPVPLSPPRDSKWNTTTSKTVVADPAERARRRQIAREQKEKEEAREMKEEMQRQFKLKLQKDEMRRQEKEDEARRKAELESELRRSSEARRRKEQAERDEEERRRLEIEQRKVADRERRLEEHRRLAEWRDQQARMAKEAARREEAAKRREINERNKKIAQVEAKVKNNSKSDEFVTGWVTMQTSENITWRRRYYRMIGNNIFLYRSPKDMHQIIDEVALRGRVKGLREWNEGYEELKAIPHSFAIEFKDDRGPWGMFCDTEEEKIKLLGLLHYAAGL